VLPGYSQPQILYWLQRKKEERLFCGGEGKGEGNSYSLDFYIMPFVEFMIVSLIHTAILVWTLHYI